jgi:putative ABC transport system permease protein
MNGVVDIGFVELFAAIALMAIAGFVSLRLELGQGKNIAISTLRCVIQLLACGFLLNYLFAWQTWWLVILVFLAMAVFATQIAISRVKSGVVGLAPSVFLSIFVSSVVVGAIVIEGVIHAEPWYSARILIPIGGMILGNAMSSIAVALDRMFSDMDAHTDEMSMLVALGATPHEAAHTSLRAAIGAGMVPVLASMSAAGMVFIPGMMSGQILAGADPFVAAKYQIVVLLMISAANTISIVMACYLTYKKRFSPEGYYLDKGIR